MQAEDLEGSAFLLLGRGVHRRFVFLGGAWPLCRLDWLPVVHSALESRLLELLLMLVLVSKLILPEATPVRIWSAIVFPTSNVFGLECRL